MQLVAVAITAVARITFQPKPCNSSNQHVHVFSQKSVSRPVRAVIIIVMSSGSSLDRSQIQFPKDTPDLQSLLKFLDHRGIASDTVCSHARLC